MLFLVYEDGVRKAYMGRLGDLVDGTPVVRALAAGGLPWPRSDESKRAVSQWPLGVGRTPNGWVPEWYESGQIGPGLL